MIRPIIASLLLAVYLAGVGNPLVDEARASKGSHARSGARPPRPPRGSKNDELRVAMERALEPAERVGLTARAVGCTLVLTDLRLLLVRDGANYRPTSGVRAWPIDGDLVLRLGRAHRQTHRLAIVRGAETASVFLSAEQVADAKLLIDRARRRTFAEGDGG